MNFNSESPYRTDLRPSTILNLRLNSKKPSSLKRSWPKWRKRIKRKASFKHSNTQTDRSRPVKRAKSSRKAPNSGPNSKRSKSNKCEKVADRRWSNKSRIIFFLLFTLPFSCKTAFSFHPAHFFMSKCVDIASMFFFFAQLIFFETKECTLNIEHDPSITSLLPLLNFFHFYIYVITLLNALIISTVSNCIQS